MNKCSASWRGFEAAAARRMLRSASLFSHTGGSTPLRRTHPPASCRCCRRCCCIPLVACRCRCLLVPPPTSPSAASSQRSFSRSSSPSRALEIWTGENVHVGSAVAEGGHVHDDDAGGAVGKRAGGELSRANASRMALHATESTGSTARPPGAAARQERLQLLEHSAPSGSPAAVAGALACGANTKPRAPHTTPPTITPDQKLPLPRSALQRGGWRRRAVIG